MKKNLLTLFALIFLAGTSCQETIDMEKEMEAIKAVIEEQTNAAFTKDFDRNAATHVQDETFIRLSAGKDGYSYLIGWEDRSSSIKEALKNNSDILPGKFENTNYKIKAYPKSAWAVYNENWYDSEGEPLGMAIETRFLEKVNGEWKIVYLSLVNTASYNEEVVREEEGETETDESE